MPLGIVTAPYFALGYTRQPNWLQMGTNEVEVSGGPPGQFTITFTTGTGPTTLVAIELVDRTITMYGTSAITANNGLEFLRDASTSQSAINFAEGCRANPYLGRHYLITRSGSSVTFYARERGVVYNGVGVVFTNTTGNFTTSPAADDVLRANYSVQVRPWLDVSALSGVYEPQGEYELEPKNGEASLDIGSILRPLLSPDMPAYGITTPYVHTTSYRQYYLQCWERFGTPPADRALQYHGTADVPNIAWLAGPQRQHAAAFDQFVYEATDPITFAATPKWFTWRNRGYERRVSATEQHTLTWYAWWSPAPGEDARMQARITYTDPNGSNPVTTSWSNRYVLDPVPTGRLVTFPVGYAALNLGAMLPVGKVLHRYDVRLFAPGPSLALTEEMSFHLAQPDYNELHLLYWSSLGAPESLRTTGAWSEPVEAANLETYRPQRAGSLYLVNEPQLRTVPGTAQRRLQVFTGYVPLGEHKALLDILNSPEIRLVEHDRQRHVPVRLLQGKAVRGQRGTPAENLHGLDLELLVDDPGQLVSEP